MLRSWYEDFRRGLDLSLRYKACAHLKVGSQVLAALLKACPPPRPEEGACPRAFDKRYPRSAPVSKEGAAPWFETPRTSLRSLSKSDSAAPHHEAARDRSITGKNDA